MENLVAAIIAVVIIMIIWLLIDAKKEKQVKIAVVLSGATVIAYNLYLFV